MLMYKKWASMKSKERRIWTEKANLNYSSMAQFVSSADSILKSVNDQMKRIDGKKLFLSTDLLDINLLMTPQKLNIYRLILTWSSLQNIIRQDDRENRKALNCFETFGTPKMTDEMMEFLIPEYPEVSVSLENKEELLQIPWERSTKGENLALSLSHSSCPCSLLPCPINLFALYFSNLSTLFSESLLLSLYLFFSLFFQVLFLLFSISLGNYPCTSFILISLLNFIFHHFLTQIYSLSLLRSPVIHCSHVSLYIELIYRLHC